MTPNWRDYFPFDGGPDDFWTWILIGGALTFLTLGLILWR